LSVVIPDKSYFKIGEVAKLVGVKPYILRYWESEFRFIRPQKSRSQHRLYRKRDVEMLLKIKELLYEQRYTVAGARIKLEAKLRGEVGAVRDGKNGAASPAVVAELSPAEALITAAPVEPMRAPVMHVSREEEHGDASEQDFALAAKDAEVQKWQRAVEERDARIAAMEVELHRLASDASEFRAALNALVVERDGLIEAREALEQRVGDGARATWMGEAGSRIAQLEGERDALRQDVERLREAEERLRREVASLGATLAQAQANKATLERELEAAGVVNREHALGLRALTGERDALLVALQSAREEHHAAMTTLRAQLLAAEAQVVRVQEEASVALQALESQQRRAADLEAVNHQLTEEREWLERDLDKAGADAQVLDSLQEEKERLQLTLHALEKSLVDVEGERSALAFQLEESQEVCQSLRLDCERYKATQRSVEELGRSMQELTRENAELQHHLRVQIQKRKMVISGLKAQVVDLVTWASQR